MSAFEDACRAATVRVSDYPLLDFLSDGAQRSVLWSMADYMVENLSHTISADELMSYSYIAGIGLKEHGLAGVLSEKWQDAMGRAFTAKVKECIEYRAEQEIRWAKEREEREARIAEANAERKAREVERAKRVLAEAGE